MDANFSHTLFGGRTGLSGLLDALEAHLTAAGASAAATSAVMIAADEVLSNVIDHGGAASVQVTASVRDGRVTVEIVDDGVAFDPLAKPAPDTGLDVEARQVGGLGVHLVRTLMDDVTYRREDGKNCLRFSKS